MNKYFMVFLFCLIPICSHARKELVLATGNKKGTYFAIGQGIKQIVEQKLPDLEIIVLATDGSIENAKLLDAGTTHLALMQNDIAYYFNKGERMFSYASDKARGVASLYTETIQIIARKDLDVNEINELKGMKISVGLKGSGTEFNAATILDAVNISYDNIVPKFMSFRNAKDSLLSATIDAAFITAGIPTPAVTDMAEIINFVPIDIDVVEKLRKTYPYFVFTNIPAQSYEGQNREVPAVGVRALLVARTDLEESTVRRIVELLFENIDDLKSTHSIVSNIRLEDATWGMTLSLHPGAMDYYRKQGVIEKQVKDYVPHIIFFIVIILIFFLTIKYRYSITEVITKNIYTKFAVFFIILYLIGTIGIYYSEKNVNENFRTVYESFWSTLLYILSGFEGRVPITTQGRITSVLILIASMGVLGLIVGKIASSLLKVREVKMPKNIRQHIVICNWSSKCEKIIKELHAPDAAPDIDIIVISSKRPVDEKVLRSNNQKEYSNVEFRESDPTFHQVLKGANAHVAKSVMILANEDSTDPDAEAGLIALAITSIWKQRIKNEVSRRTKPTATETEKDNITKRVQLEEDFKKPHIVAEVVNHRKAEHLLDAGVDEIICATDYGIGLLAQCTLYEKLSTAYQQLLTYSKDTCEIYLVDDPKVMKWAGGKTFEEVASFLNQQRNPENPAILIGFRRGNNIILNPREQGVKAEKKHLRFVEGDCLVVLSYEYPELSKIIPV